VLPAVSAYWPATQSTQLLWLDISWLLPVGQLVQLAVPESAANENLPASQLLHAFCPVSATYWPAAQLVQLVWPVEAWNLPDGHAAQAAAAEPKNWPAEQLVQVSFFWLGNWPASQAVQLGLPIELWMLPAAQSVQPFAAAAENMPTPQLAHRTRPVALANCPPAQSTQLLAPVAA